MICHIEIFECQVMSCHIEMSFILFTSNNTTSVIIHNSFEKYQLDVMFFYGTSLQSYQVQKL